MWPEALVEERQEEKTLRGWVSGEVGRRQAHLGEIWGQTQYTASSPHPGAPCPIYGAPTFCSNPEET